MNRRELLSLTPLLGLFGFNKIKGDDDHFYYKDWEVRWMGWHMIPPYLHQYCMYLAKYKGQGDTILYASYPGQCGIATAQHSINTFPQEERGQVTVCPFSTDADLKKYQMICKKDIIRVIDDYNPKMG